MTGSTATGSMAGTYWRTLLAGGILAPAMIASVAVVVFVVANLLIGASMRNASTLVFLLMLVGLFVTVPLGLFFAGIVIAFRYFGGAISRRRWVALVACIVLLGGLVALTVSASLVLAPICGGSVAGWIAYRWRHRLGIERLFDPVVEHPEAAVFD